MEFFSFFFEVLQSFREAKAQNQDFKDMDVFCSTEDYTNLTELKPIITEQTFTQLKPNSNQNQVHPTHLNWTEPNQPD